MQMVKWLAGNHFSHPHFHPHDRFITVIKGTWWVGSGTKFDPGATVPMPAGTFVTHFGQQVHFDGAKDEDAVLLIVGEGPGTSTPARSQMTQRPQLKLPTSQFRRRRLPAAAGRLIRSSTRSIEAISTRLRPLSLARYSA